MLAIDCLDLIVKAVLSSLRQPTCNITIEGYSKANYLSKSFPRKLESNRAGLLCFTGKGCSETSDRQNPIAFPPSLAVIPARRPTTVWDIYWK